MTGHSDFRAMKRLNFALTPVFFEATSTLSASSPTTSLHIPRDDDMLDSEDIRASDEKRSQDGSPIRT